MRDILHAEFTATKTIGKWTIGPVAYYAGHQDAVDLLHDAPRNP
jgi:hypothetical protein